MHIAEILTMFYGLPSDKHTIDVGLGDIRAWATELADWQASSEAYRQDSEQLRDLLKRSVELLKDPSGDEIAWLNDVRLILAHGQRSDSA